VSQCTATYHQAVEAFKKHLIRTTLASTNGNRTHAARALGLQRTYLLRLLRDFEIREPRAQRPRAGHNGN